MNRPSTVIVFATLLQVSQLTTLRVLYLHDMLHRTAPVAAGDWDALHPLRRLAFLSISCNRLAQLPPAVADMSQLRVSLGEGWWCGGEFRCFGDCRGLCGGHTCIACTLW